MLIEENGKLFLQTFLGYGLGPVDMIGEGRMTV